MEKAVDQLTRSMTSIALNERRAAMICQHQQRELVYR